MPEIIEVKMYSDFIKKNIKDNKLLSIKILNGRYKKHGPFEHYKKIINELPCIIEEINTKGKFMYMKFNDDLYLGVSLGLMGGWFFRKKAIKLKIINKKDKLPENYKVIPKEYTDKFLVYYRNEDYYGNKIVKEKLYEGNQIRYIYWVPKLQK
jgi:formamidopyrimidine-DNA glycosylase